MWHNAWAFTKNVLLIKLQNKRPSQTEKKKGRRSTEFTSRASSAASGLWTGSDVEWFSVEQQRSPLAPTTGTSVRLSRIFQLHLPKGTNPQLVLRKRSMRLPFVLSMGNKSISLNICWNSDTTLPQKAAKKHSFCHFWIKSWWQGRPRSGKLHLHISELSMGLCIRLFPVHHKHTVCMWASKCKAWGYKLCFYKRFFQKKKKQGRCLVTCRCCVVVYTVKESHGESKNKGSGFATEDQICEIVSLFA